MITASHDNYLQELDMSLTKEQSKLVKSSFGKIAPFALQAANTFYARLFEIAPETKDLFIETDMTLLGNKLMQVIGTVVSSVDHIEGVTPSLRTLGARHISYKVSEAHYKPVREALLYTMATHMGTAFDDETREAWEMVFDMLIERMIEGAETTKP